MDCTIEVDNLNVGKLNHIRNKIVTYSGKALNVAVGVSRLQAEAFATGFMFSDDGKTFENMLEKEGVKNRFVWNKGGVRVNYKIIDKRSMLTEINDKGEEVTADKQEELISLVSDLSTKANIVVMSGSLPKGVEPSFYGKVLKAVPKNVKIVVDTQKENLAEAFDSEIYLVRPNLRELENFVGSSLLDKNEIAKGAYTLLDKGVKNVLVSLGSDGAIFINEKERLFCKSANVAINSTVGAGDCMVAAACVEIEKGSSFEEILKCSVAAGTAAITTSGTNLFYKSKYDEIYNRIFVEKF